MSDYQRKVHNTPFAKSDNIKKNLPPKKNIHYPKNNNINNNNETNNINDELELEEQSKNTNKKQNMYLMKRIQNSIDPEAIPHPCEFEDFFFNDDNDNIFATDVGKHPPHSITKYTVKGTENSSSRLIRSSLIKFPTDQNLLNKIGIAFGLYCQPFADFSENEKEIPKVDASKGFFRCRNCNAYANNKFQLLFA